MITIDPHGVGVSELADEDHFTPAPVAQSRGGYTAFIFAPADLRRPVGFCKGVMAVRKRRRRGRIFLARELLRSGLSIGCGFGAGVWRRWLNPPATGWESVTPETTYRAPKKKQANNGRNCGRGGCGVGRGCGGGGVHSSIAPKRT